MTLQTACDMRCDALGVVAVLIEDRGMHTKEQAKVSA
jgi:hypothetical protein